MPQIAESLFAEQLAKDIKNPAAERLSLQLDLLKKAFVNVAFTGLFRQEVP